jgi:multicomponent Na+:H+ antiporter subunit E
VPLSILLFIFWVILSGKFDAFHLTIGAASAFWIAWYTQRLLLLPPAIGPQSVHPVIAVPWYRLLAYLPWLLWQIVLASFQVAYIVLHPAMPATPRVVRCRTPLPHLLARLTLSTSITLTPGTVTLDVLDDVFVIHTLTGDSSSDLEPPYGSATMQSRVAAMYTPSARL